MLTGRTPLEMACACAHVTPARTLLANGAAVNGADPAKSAPLAAACAAGECRALGQGRSSGWVAGYCWGTIADIAPRPAAQ